jgi:hypothetical protein
MLYGHVNEEVSLKNSERNNKLTREEASPLETRALFI